MKVRYKIQICEEIFKSKTVNCKKKDRLAGRHHTKFWDSEINSKSHLIGNWCSRISSTISVTAVGSIVQIVHKEITTVCDLSSPMVQATISSPIKTIRNLNSNSCCLWMSASQPPNSICATMIWSRWSLRNKTTTILNHHSVPARSLPIRTYVGFSKDISLAGVYTCSCSVTIWC